MKKSSLLFLFMVASLPVVWSQTYQIYEKQAASWIPVTNGSTINRSCIVQSEGVNEGFAVRSTAGEERKTWARKIVQTQVDKAQNAFCWNGCMTPEQCLSKTYLKMKPDSLYTEQFTVHFLPAENIGSSQILYSFFDRDHMADSAWFTIVYTIMTSIDDFSDIPFRMTASPNPANKSVIFRGLPANFNGNITMTNLLGKRIRVINIVHKTTDPVVDLTDLAEGIYFFYPERNGSKGSAGKLIIRR